MPFNFGARQGNSNPSTDRNAPPPDQTPEAMRAFQDFATQFSAFMAQHSPLQMTTPHAPQIPNVPTQDLVQGFNQLQK